MENDTLNVKGEEMTVLPEIEFVLSNQIRRLKEVKGNLKEVNIKYNL